jgi:hypothetical protein
MKVIGLKNDGVTFYGHVRPPAVSWTRKDGKWIRKETPSPVEELWVVVEEPNIMSLGVDYIGDTKKFLVLETRQYVCGCHYWIKIQVTPQNGNTFVGWCYCSDDENFSVRK